MTTPARAPGRPLNAAIDDELLKATQDLLIQEGFERLTVEAVARRCGASKATIYRRWSSKTDLVIAAAVALFEAPETPDRGDLREDLIDCGRAYLQRDGRSAQVLASVLTASRHDPVLREASQQALGAPFSGLFDRVLSRAVSRGLVDPDRDIATIAQVFPAMAYEQVSARGRLVDADDVQRIVDAVLIPALGISAVGPSPT